MENETQTNWLENLALGAAVSAAAVLLATQVYKQTEGYRNRRRVKKFIRKNWNGNQKILTVVDKIPDEKIKWITKTMDNTHQAAAHVANATQNFSKKFK